MLVRGDTASTESRSADGTEPAGIRRIRLRDFGLAFALLGMIAVFSVARPDQFLTTDNLHNILVTASEPLVMTVGMTFVMIAGQLDLSVGSILVLASVVGGKVMVAVGGDATLEPPHHLGIAIALGVLAGVATGALVGAVNGLLITKLRLNSLIVTLGMFGAALGLAQVISSGFNVIGVPQQLQTEFGANVVFGLPLPVWLALLLALIGGVWLRLTAFGRRTYATGSNPAGARRAGVAVDRHLLVLFLLIGLLSGVAGIIDLARFDTTSLSGHTVDNLTVISAVVIGGTSLSGGRGTMFGTLIGTLVPVVLQIGLLVLGIEPFWQTFAIGVVLVLAVALDSGQRRQEQRRFT